MLKRTLSSLLTGIGLLISMTACSTGGGSPSSIPSSLPETQPSSTATTAAPTTQTTQPPGDFNMLTGESDLLAGAVTRPVAVMIGNNDKSRPQYGLEEADMYVEAETEGGITRMMAVFANSSRIPSQLGPVRSARSPFALLAQSLDAVYCHAGGSSAGLTTLKTIGLHHIDALVYDGSTYWRDAILRKTKGAEYSMMTSGDKITARIKSAKIRQTTNLKKPYTFGEVNGSGAGKTLQVTFSGAQTISFQYDEATGLYKKGNGKLGHASAHKTANGKQLTASNIVVMYDTKFAENNTTISFHLKSGSGLLVSGGTSRNIHWTRTRNALTFTEENGSTAKLAKGKTYICLVVKGNAGSTIVG